jgi:prophage regulatory protein
MTMKRIATQESRSAGVDQNRASHEVAKPLSKLDHLPLKLLRFGAVRERTGLSRSTVWRLERRGEFPRHMKISANVVAWLEEDVVKWIRSKT